MGKENKGEGFFGKYVLPLTFLFFAALISGMLIYHAVTGQPVILPDTVL